MNPFRASCELGRRAELKTRAKSEDALVAEATKAALGHPDYAQSSLRQKWEAAIQADDHRVSDYATTSVQEDVAETVALYYQVKGTPDEAVMKRDFPNRHAAVKELLGER